MKTKTEIQPMKQNISFVDKTGSKVIANVEITFRNGYAEFSMSGQYKGSSGQCFESVKPANKAQAELLAFWKQWHLNGTHAGTEKQEVFLATKENAWKKAKAKGVSHYDWACSILKKKRLLTDKYKGKPYKYGHGWILRPLPSNVNEILTGILNRIKEGEEKRRDKEPDLSAMDDQELIDHIESNTEFTGRDAELCAAFVRMFDLSAADLGNIEIEDTRATIQGTEYIAGDNAEMDVEWEKDLENVLDDCILPEAKLGQYERYFDREQWIEDAKQDGRGHSLNRWDGSEEEAKINETYYYAYQQ